MIHGILNVYKETEMTSHDVVAILRGLTKQRRIGHTGTLDPMVTGVLPICFGNATRLSEYISDRGKAYIGTLEFGYSTNTLDQTGDILETSEKINFTTEEVKDCFSKFIGTIDQLPPMFSAVKIAGKKLYELARVGKEIERKPRKITIHRLDVLEHTENKVKFLCSCSKGTYIRQLVYDIGISLGTLATMIQLERVEVGPFKIEDAVSVSKLKKMTVEEIEKRTYPMDYAVDNLPKIKLSNREGYLVRNGVKVELDEDKHELHDVDIYNEETTYRVYDERFIGLGNFACDDGIQKLKVGKMLDPNR